MLFRLALRNVMKSLPKRAVFGAFFSITVALLFLGNTIFENSDRGLSSTYIKSFTAQVSVSAPSEEQFTLFGSDLPLVGEFLVLPVLPDADGLRKTIDENLPGARYQAQVSAAGSLAMGDYQQGVPVFGVDFRSYFQFFPSLKLLTGELPDVTEPAILLTGVQAAKVAERLGRPLRLGDKMTLSFAVGNSFVIREVSLAGTYAYPSSDPLLDRIVLTDPDTARSLNGYLYGAAEAVPLDSSTKKVMDSDLGDLFESAEDSVGDSGSTQSAQASVQALADQAPSAPVKGSLEGAWNFLLVAVPGQSDSEVLSSLQRLYQGRDIQLRGWRESAGGTALIAWFLRWVFNAGILFIALVSCMILMNSLALSVLERTREIGTMRALGAGKDFVGGLIAWETLLIVIGAGLLGIALGTLGCLVLSALHLTIENVYVSSLFGGQTLELQVTWQGVVLHLILSFVLGLVAIVLPIRRALRIDPVKAIARDQ